MPYLRWSTVEIEKAITRILKSYELKGILKVCGARQSHECLLGIVSAQKCYQNSGVAILNLCTVAYGWAPNVGKCFLQSLLSTC